MRKCMLVFIVIIFSLSPLLGQEKAEDMFSSEADRADVLIKIAGAEEPPIELSGAEKEEFKQIVELIRADKPVKALEKWKKFRDRFGESWTKAVAGNMINFLLREALLKTDKELLKQTEEIANLDIEKEDDKKRYDSLYSELTESMKIKNSQYDLVTRILRFYNKIWKF